MKNTATQILKAAKTQATKERVAATVTALESAVNVFGARGKQLIRKGQKLHSIDGDAHGFTKSAIWSIHVGLTIVESASIAIAIVCVLTALSGLLLGSYVGRWYYGNNVQAEAIALMADAEAGCEVVGVWIGRRVYEVIKAYRWAAEWVQAVREDVDFVVLLENV